MNTKTAKHKLNSAYFVGITVVAAFVGLITQSLTICIATLAILIAAMIHSGSMRL